MNTIKSKLEKDNNVIYFNDIETEFPSKALRIYNQKLESYKTQEILGQGKIKIEDKQFSFKGKDFVYSVKLEIFDFVDKSFVPKEKIFVIKYKENQQEKDKENTIKVYPKESLAELFENNQEKVKITFKDSEHNYANLVVAFSKYIKACNDIFKIREVCYGFKEPFRQFNSKGKELNIQNKEHYELSIKNNNRVLEKIEAILERKEYKLTFVSKNKKPEALEIEDVENIKNTILTSFKTFYDEKIKEKYKIDNYFVSIEAKKTSIHKQTSSEVISDKRIY